MKLIDAKFGMAVHVGGKECLYANANEFECHLVYREDIKMTVVEVKHLRTGGVSWTSFANVVYCRPVTEEQELKVESSSDKKGYGARKAATPIASAKVEA